MDRDEGSDRPYQLRFAAGDTVKIWFDMQPNRAAPEWHGTVIQNPTWFRTGHVALSFKRPKISSETFEIEGTRSQIYY